MTPVSPYVTRPLSPDTWDDFSRLVEANNGVWGGCWCMGFHPEDVGKGHTVSGNRLAKQAHVRNGTVHQILVYDGNECVGWCQYGPPVELPNIKNPKAYAKGLGECPFRGCRELVTPRRVVVAARVFRRVQPGWRRVR
jgi:hypothetical protein